MSRAVCPTRSTSKQHHGKQTHREDGPTKADRNRPRLEQSEPISVWKRTQERQESLPPNTSTSDGTAGKIRWDFAFLGHTASPEAKIIWRTFGGDADSSSRPLKQPARKTNSAQRSAIFGMLTNEPIIQAKKIRDLKRQQKISTVFMLVFGTSTSLV